MWTRFDLCAYSTRIDFPHIRIKRIYKIDFSDSCDSQESRNKLVQRRLARAAQQIGPNLTLNFK